MPKRLRWVAESWHEDAFRLATVIIDRSNLDLFFVELMALEHPKRQPGQRGPGRVPVREYTVRAMLVAQIMCLVEGIPLSLSNMLHVIWHFTYDHLLYVGMADAFSDSERDLMNDPAFRSVEYDRLQNQYDAMVTVVDSSPHRRMFRERNDARRARERTLPAPERARLAQHDENLTAAIGLIIEAGSRGARPSFYRGHVQVDESWFPAWASTARTGTRADKLGSADTGAAWRFDKNHGFSQWVFMVFFTQMATMPYERRVPNVITGMRARLPRGESVEAASAAAVQMHLDNGFGPTSGRTANMYGDRGITGMRALAQLMLERGYRVVSSPLQEAPGKGFLLPEGAMLIGAQIACPGAVELLQHRQLPVLDFDTATAAELRARQDIIDAITPFIMPTNGNPVPYPDGSKKAGKFHMTVICPHAAGQVDCPIYGAVENPDLSLPFVYNAPGDAKTPTRLLPAVCNREEPHTRLTLDAGFLKHLDVMLHGSPKHADHMMNIRSANERPHAAMKRRDMGSFERGSIFMMGRARVFLAVAFVAAIESIREVERVIAEYGSVDNLPHTPRLYAARRRDKLIAEERRLRP